MPLNEDQKFIRRIKQRVKKKNDKLRERYPLLWQQWATDYETEETIKIEQQGWSFERWCENFDMLSWQTWFKIEMAKRVITRAGRRDLIFQAYRIYFKYYHFRNQNYALIDLLIQALSNLTGCKPLQISMCIEKKTEKIFEDLKDQSGIHKPGERLEHFKISDLVSNKIR